MTPVFFTSRWWVVVIGASVNLGLLAVPLLVAPAQPVGWGVIAFLAIVSVWCLTEGLAHRPWKPVSRSASGPRWLPGANGLAILLTFLVCVASRPIGGSHLVSLLGAVLMLLGLTLRLAAIRALGPDFLDEVAVPLGHRLVTHGIFGWIRHPSEAGSLLLVGGSVLLLWSGLGLAVALATVLPGIVGRIWLEDRALAVHHGETFRRYARGVPAFVPRLARPGRRIQSPPRWTSVSTTR